MTALKNRVYAFLAQQKEAVRETVARETNIFSAKGQKVRLLTIIYKVWKEQRNYIPYRR